MSLLRGAGTANYFRPYDLRHTAATLLAAVIPFRSHSVAFERHAQGAAPGSF